jgi:hypothetical protein
MNYTDLKIIMGDTKMNKRREYATMFFMILLLVAFVAGCSSSGDNGGGSPDITAPTVITTIPIDLATGVPLNSTVNTTFSEAMDPATITVVTFTLQQGTTPVSGTVTYVGTTAIFTPASNLMASTVYTATITTGVKDLAGNALAAAYTWTFTTGTVSDTTAPTVNITNPTTGATGVGVNSAIAATFSEAMMPSTVNADTFILSNGVRGVVTYTGVIATFTPTSNLASSTTYTATISTGVKDAAGNAMAAAYTWTFTTGTAPDTTAPTVRYTVPIDLATAVPLNSTVKATFSEAMNPATITIATLTVKQGTTPVSGTVTYVGTTAIFTPASNLTSGTVYTATITTGVKDLAGNSLAANKVWSFTTGTTAAAGPAPVILGTAGNYVILAKSGISATGVTAVTGDLGLSPAAASFITGFSLIADSTNVFSTSSLVTGQIFAADYAVPTPSNLTTAVLDMMIAYTDAAGRTLPDHTELGAGDISTMTLTPGLYKWGTGLHIDNRGVTLTGGANDVWIFQIAQDLTVDNTAIITLSGGAQGKNIFWQVAGQATLGTTSNFKGIILCQTAIVLQTGSTVNGRLLAQTAVTLDASTVTQP